jgi:hypothetical protein
MEAFRQQARAVAEQLAQAGGTTTDDLVGKAQALYVQFEDAADPYVEPPHLGLSLSVHRGCEHCLWCASMST